MMDSKGIGIGIGISERDLGRIVEQLREVGSIRRALLFGSRAMGTFRDGSDIDIAIDALSMNHATLLRLCTNLDDLLLPQKIDIVLIHEIDHPALADHIMRVGIDLL